MFRTLPFTVGEDDDLKHPAQEQEERRVAMIDFEFHRGLKNSTTTSYDKSDRQFGMTVDRDSINDYLIFWVSPW
jgi:hypothetical protein